MKTVHRSASPLQSILISSAGDFSARHNLQQHQYQPPPPPHHHRPPQPIPPPPQPSQAATNNGHHGHHGHEHNGHNGHGHSHDGHHGHGHDHHGHSHEVRLPRREKVPFSLYLSEVRLLLLHPSSRRISALACLNAASIALTTYWASTTNSLALTAYTYVSWFHVLNLLTCYLTLWIQVQSQKTLQRNKGHSNSNTPSCDIGTFNLGYGRFEVLAVFSAAVLCQLAGLFGIKESVERLLDPPEIHTGRLLLGALACLLTQLICTYLAPCSTALTHVAEVSQSSFLQEHAADISHSICQVCPPLSAWLLPRLNPLALLSVVGFVLVVVLEVILEINNAHSADCLVSLVFSLLLVCSMHPMTLYTGRILLQTTPSHVVPQLDRVLREAITIDGVLEFKHEHFWTVSFGKLAGSLTVRIRKDADEQLVLAHLTNRLSSLVWPLTIQISKDDHVLAKLQQTSLNFIGADKINASRGMFHKSLNLDGTSSMHSSLSPGMSPVNGVNTRDHKTMYLSPHETGNGSNVPSPVSGMLTSTPKNNDQSRERSTAASTAQPVPDLLAHGLRSSVSQSNFGSSGGVSARQNVVNNAFLTAGYLSSNGGSGRSSAFTTFVPSSESAKFK